MAVGTPASVTAANGARLLGRVRMVAPTVDPQTRSGLVYVDLPPMQAPANAAAPGRPKQGTAPTTGGSAAREATSVGVIPGMFARGEFELGQSGALTVPQQSVVVRDGFNYAFRLNADQRVSQVKLQIGRRVGDRVEVLDGISADAVLVASGAGFLNDGDLVKVVAAPAVAAASAPTSAPNKPLAPVASSQEATK
jgi:hypothetical protein